MFWSKKSEREDEELDRLGRQLLKAHALSEREADEAAPAQLYAQVRARIAAQSSRPRPASGFWTLALRVAAVITIFVTGAVTGSMINSYYGREQITNNAPAPHDAAIITEAIGGDSFEGLKRALNLNEEQALATRAILTEMTGEYSNVCVKVKPQYEVLQVRARARLRALLRPDQQQLFDAITPRNECECPAQTRCMPVMTLCLK